MTAAGIGRPAEYGSWPDCASRGGGGAFGPRRRLGRGAGRRRPGGRGGGRARRRTRALSRLPGAAPESRPGERRRDPASAAGLALGLVLLPTCYVRPVAQPRSDAGGRRRRWRRPPSSSASRTRTCACRATSPRAPRPASRDPRRPSEVARLHLTTTAASSRRGWRWAISSPPAASRPTCRITGCRPARWPSCAGREPADPARQPSRLPCPLRAGLFGESSPVHSSGESRAYLSAGLKPDFVDQVLYDPQRDVWFPDSRAPKQAGAISPPPSHPTACRIRPSRRSDPRGRRGRVLRAVALNEGVQGAGPRPP